MSRPGPVLTANGRAGAATSSPSVRRARPPRTVADVVLPAPADGWGPHPDAQAHRESPPDASVAVMPPPVAGAVGMLAPAPVPRPVRAARPAVPAAPAEPAADPTLLPALAPRPDRPLTFVQRVTLMLQRLSRSQGRHRTGHSVHHWSMFAPHQGARRRSGGRPRR